VADRIAFGRQRLIIAPMPKINLSVPHNLSQEDAKFRVTSAIADCRTRFSGRLGNVTECWTAYTNAFSFKAMGFFVSGQLDVQPGQLHVELHLPLAAYPFKSRIESEILAHARQLLA
jgi:hypothetical protein